MSAVFEPLNTKLAAVLPADFMEPITSPTQSQQSTGYVESSQFFSGFGSSENSSLNSSRGRLQDSGITSSAMSSAAPDWLNSPPLMGFGNDDDFEPQVRDRCNTWPRSRPNLEPKNTTSPLMHERIEEEPYFDQNGSQKSVFQDQYAPNGYPLQRMESQDQEVGLDMSPVNYSGSNSPDSGADFQTPAQKRSQTRRNAWGNMSYAEMITQAILSAPDQRLTLSQIYDWMVQNVPYFRDKGDTNSSAGWKNSIRHNLSLHSRFMRVQNEGAGKSSWWVINPEAKHGRSPRRRAATMDTSTKAIIDKKRRGARKRVEMQGSMQGMAESVTGSQISIASHDQFNECNEESLGPNFAKFRARTQSNVSTSNAPPSPHNFYDEYLPHWASSNAPPVVQAQQQIGAPSNVNEILDRTDQMRLDTELDFRKSSGIKEVIQGQQRRNSPQMSNGEETEQIGLSQPPPAYQEMNIIQSPNQMRPNLMHNQMQSHRVQDTKMMSSNNGASSSQFYQSNVYNMPSQSSSMISQPRQHQTSPTSLNGHWSSASMTQTQMIPQQLNNGYVPHSLANNSNLPSDLESVNLYDFDDVDAFLKSEFAQ